VDRDGRPAEGIRLVGPQQREPAAFGRELVALPGQLLLFREQLPAGGKPLGV
jgi:hypothetical protein